LGETDFGSDVGDDLFVLRESVGVGKADSETTETSIVDSLKVGTNFRRVYKTKNLGLVVIEKERVMRLTRLAKDLDSFSRNTLYDVSLVSARDFARFVELDSFFSETRI